MGFFTDYLSDAKKASAATGVLTSVILAQWADETGYGTSYAFVHQNNYAGISYGGYVNGFPTKAIGLNAYITVLNQSNYDTVRAAHGWNAQAVALGMSQWAEARYNAKAYDAGARCSGDNTGPTCPTLLANAGIDLVSIIQANALTQYDPPGSGGDAATTGPNGTGLPNPAQQFASMSIGAQIPLPPPGFNSNLGANEIIINGDKMDLAVQDAMTSIEGILSIEQASSIILTLQDPKRTLINEPQFNEKSVLSLGGSGWQFSLASIEKGGDVLTVTFEAYIVAALRTATGAFTVDAGQMTRSAFATMLINQVNGATAVTAPESYLYSLDEGYARPSQETLSRGTSDNPLEDSWTCLQRLAQEIQWVCFECLGQVYFVPYSWLASQPPVWTPVEFQGGVNTIDGTWDTGQPLGNLDVDCEAGNQFPIPGSVAKIGGLGPFNGNWILSEFDRTNMEEPEVKITLMQPLPNLPEPNTGGAVAAVAAGNTTPGNVQSQGGSQAAKQAVAYCIAQAGKPYVWGGSGPQGYDCSGLVMAAYATVGISMPHNTVAQWDDTAIAHVPAGIRNLLPGDLVYFAGGDPPAPGHVAIVTKVDLANNDVIVFDAFSSQEPLNQQIRYDHFGYVDPGGQTAFAGAYYGAIRPAP